MKTFANSQIFNDDISAYNTALRIAEEQIEDKASMKVSKSFSLSAIMETFGREYAEFSDFLAGKLSMTNKAGGLEIKLVGVSFYSRQEALKRLTHYDPKDIHAILVPEFDNPYDSNAIAVKVLVNGAKATYRLGYVPREETSIVKAFLGKVPELEVIQGDLIGARLTLVA